ncbi:uncharacterized protein LOC143258930 [Megalopta genalis]|uniref:uncharacterized protein LOC143258930 n=1 Tax=Megalopta genalis TaxID=115081 RepID=UPI003FCFBFD2
MNEPLNKDFSYAMRLIKIVSWPVGTWPLQKYNFVSGMRSFVCVILLLMMLTIMNVELYLDNGDAEKSMDTLIMIVCGVLSLWKILWFRMRPKGLVANFLSALKDYNELVDQEKKVIVRRHARMGRIAWCSVIFSSYIGCTVITMLPMLQEEEKPEVEDYNVTRADLLNYPLPSEYTLDLLDLPASLYPVCYIGEMIVLLVISTGNLGSDSLLYGIIFHVCGQTELLKLEFSRCFEVDEKEARVDALITRHQELLKLSEDLNDTFSPIVLVQLFSSCVMICLNGFQLIQSMNKSNIALTIKALVIVVVQMSQLFAYSYVGEYLKNQFEGVGYCVYCSTWYNIPRKRSLDVVFVLMNSQNPFQLKAGRFFVVNMETYMSIVKTSMSYLSVLRVMCWQHAAVAERLRDYGCIKHKWKRATYRRVRAAVEDAILSLHLARMKLPTDKDFAYEMSIMKMVSWPVGTWPLQEYDLLSGLRSVATLVLLVLLLIILLVEVYLDHGDAAKNMEVIVMMSCSSLAILKVAWFRFRCTGLVANFVSAVKDYQELKEEEKRAIVKHHAHMSRNAIGFVLFIMYFTVAMTALHTIFEMSHCAPPPTTLQFATEEEATENLSRTAYKCERQYELPIPSEDTLVLLDMPKDIYALICLGEFMLLLVLAFGNMGSDTLFIGILFHLCGQVEVLKLDFSRFVEHGVDSGKRFDALVNRHCHLLTLAEHLNNTIKYILVLQLFSSCYLICLIGIQVILFLQANNIAMAIKTFMVINIIMSQLFAYSYVGEYSKNQFEGIGYLAYCSDWYNAPCDLSRKITFVLMKSEYSVELKAGNYFPINLQSYMNILKTSMSYLSVLRVMIT